MSIWKKLFGGGPQKSEHAPQPNPSFAASRRCGADALTGKSVVAKREIVHFERVDLTDDSPGDFSLSGLAKHSGVTSRHRELLEGLALIDDSDARAFMRAAGVADPIRVPSASIDKVFLSMASASVGDNGVADVYYLAVSDRLVQEKECMYAHYKHSSGYPYGLIVCRTKDGAFLAYNDGEIGNRLGVLEQTPTADEAPAIAVDTPSGVLRAVAKNTLALTGDVRRFALFPDAKLCVIAYKSGNCCIIDTATGSTSHSIDLSTSCNQIELIKVSRDGKCIAVSCFDPNCVRIFDHTLQNEIGHLDIPPGYTVDSLDFTSDFAHLLASGLNVSEIYVWDIGARKLRYSFRSPNNPSCTTFYGGCESLLASLSFPSRIAVLQGPDGTCKQEFPRSKEATGLAASADGRHFMSWSWKEEQFALWHAGKAAPKAFSVPEFRKIKDVQFKGKGNRAFVLSDKSIALLDASAGTLSDWIDLSDYDIYGEALACWVGDSDDRIFLVGCGFYPYDKFVPAMALLEP